MIKIAIVDDEKKYQNIISKIVRESYGEDVQITQFEDGVDILSQDTEFDIVLLDIMMTNSDGIDVSKKIQEKVKYIIFVTSFKDRVFEAFGSKVFAYVLKSELEDKLAKILKGIQIEENIKVNFITPEGEVEIVLNDIYQIYRESRKIYLMTYKKTIQIYQKSLKEVYELLNKEFLYVDKSSIVNIKYIKSLNENILTLDNNQKVDVSRSRLKEVKKELLQGEFYD